MAFVIEICLIVTALLVWWKVRDGRKYAGYPPGPSRLPLLGNLLQVALQGTAYPPLALQKLAAKYGEVMFIKMGMMDTVVISSQEAVSEGLHSDAILDRHMIALMKDRNMDGNRGILLASGNVWHSLRRFTIRTLRDFGFGKSASMDDAINDEVEKFERHLKQLMKQQNGVVHVENLFDMPVLNVVWRMVTGKSHELDDARMKRLLKLSHEYVRSTHVMDISVAYPTLRDWFPGLTGRTRQLECLNSLKDFFKDLIDEQKKAEAYENPECFVDVFLAKMMDEAEKDTEFNNDQLVYVLLDLFQGASDTTSATLSFALLHMICNPEIQRRVREEINCVIPADSVVTIAMKSSLPYTSATILETLRYSPVIPLAVPREVTRDVVIRGHKLKKGTSITFNLEAVLHQKSIWEDSDIFRPERFLTSDGTRINSKVTDNMIAFSGGKRACLGQSVAETTLLIYFVNLIRHFEFSIVVNQPKPRADPKVGLTNAPHPFDIYVVERRQ